MCVSTHTHTPHTHIVVSITIVYNVLFIGNHIFSFYPTLFVILFAMLSGLNFQVHERYKYKTYELMSVHI